MSLKVSGWYSFFVIGLSKENKTYLIFFFFKNQVQYFRCSVNCWIDLTSLQILGAISWFLQFVLPPQTLTALPLYLILLKMKTKVMKTTAALSSDDQRFSFLLKYFPFASSCLAGFSPGTPACSPVQKHSR